MKCVHHALAISDYLIFITVYGARHRSFRVQLSYTRIVMIFRPSSRSLKLPGSKIRQVVAEVSQLKKNGVDVYELHVGEPGLPPAKELVEELCQDMLRDPHKYFRYTPAPGLEQVRQAVIENYSQDAGVSLGLENISLCAGSSEAIFASLIALLEEGDEVIIFDPEYLLYRPVAEYLGGQVKLIPVTIEREFNPDPEQVKSAVSRRTKVFIFVNPDNPTGRTSSEDIVKLIVDLAEDYNFYIIYDEAYRELYYEGSHIYAVKYNLDHVIALNTFSKGAAMPGWRLGFVVAQSDFIKHFTRVLQHINLNPPTIAQYAAYLYVTKYKKKYLEEVIPIYRKKRDEMYSAVKEHLPEARTFKPRAGLFMFIDIKSYLEKLKMSDEEFCRAVLRESHVSMIPGSAFGEAGKGHVRLCFARESPERIREAIRRVGEFIRNRTG